MLDVSQLPAGPFRPFVGTLGYIFDRSRGEVLMIRRDARPDDDHFGKINGLGGKVEPDESIAASLRRELAEEAGIELTSFSMRGTIHLDELRAKARRVARVRVPHRWLDG